MSPRFWRILRRLFLVLAALLAVALAFRWEENWRGARELAQCEEELHRAGEKLEMRFFAPPSVPDAKNFAAAPIMQKLLALAENDGAKMKDPESIRLRAVTLPSKSGRPDLGGWEFGQEIDLSKWAQYLGDSPNNPNEKLGPEKAAQEVIAALAKFEPELAAFSAAAARPAASFPVHYEQGFGFSARHYTIFIRFAQLYCLRGKARLSAGQSDLAFQDLVTLFHLQAALRPEPLSISLLVRRVTLDRFHQLLWEGLLRHGWTAAQLEQTQTLLAGENWTADFQRAVRGERAFGRICYERLRESTRPFATMQAQIPGFTFPTSSKWFFKLLPSGGILDQNEATMDRALQDFLPTVDPSARRIFPRRVESLERGLKSSPATPYNFLFKIALPIYPNFLRRIATAEVANEEARTACAIERFRLTTERLPTNLSELVPAFLSKLPPDGLADRPLQFVVAPNGSYLLYSIGWNQTDENGVVVTKANSKRRDDDKGDWVWRIGGVSSPPAR